MLPDKLKNAIEHSPRLVATPRRSTGICVRLALETTLTT
jgi:hypothetical protein